jgi:hypothetical protein
MNGVAPGGSVVMNKQWLVRLDLFVLSWSSDSYTMWSWETAVGFHWYAQSETQTVYVTRPLSDNVTMMQLLLLRYSYNCAVSRLQLHVAASRISYTINSFKVWLRPCRTNATVPLSSAYSSFLYVLHMSVVYRDTLDIVLHHIHAVLSLKCHYLNHVCVWKE